MRRTMAALGMAALLATAGVGWRAAAGPSTSLRTTAPHATTTSRRPVTTTTTSTSTTVAPTTTTAPPPTTTTTAPTPTTAARRVTPTTRPPVTPTTSSPPPTTAPAPPVTGGPPASVQSALLSAINARRATGTTCGGTWYPAVPALAVQSQLTNAAQGHAADMATNNYFSHTAPNGADPIARMTAAGYRGTAWAENIAAGQTSVDEVMTAWWNSSGHCENFMAGFVSQIGFGLAQNPSSTYGIYWVADMGRPG